MEISLPDNLSFQKNNFDCVCRIAFPPFTCCNNLHSLNADLLEHLVVIRGFSRGASEALKLTLCFTGVMPSNYYKYLIQVAPFVSIDLMNSFSWWCLQCALYLSMLMCHL